VEHLTLAQAWAWTLAFFAEPIPVFGLGLARALLGLVIVIDGLRHLIDAHIWLAPEALGTRPKGSKRSHFGLVHRPRTYLVVHCILASLFSLGLGGGFVAVIVYISLRQIHQVDRYVLYGGDTVIRIALVALAASPCTAAISLDRWIAAGDLGLSVEAPPWGMRLLQIDLCILYFYNCWYKSKFKAWRDGTAVYYTLLNSEIRNHRFPIPRLVLRPAVIAVGTWGTLVLECALGPGLWFQELRLPLVIGAALLHLAIAYAFSLWLFSYIMLACLCVFVSPQWFFAESALADAPVHAWGPTSGPLLVVAVVLAVIYVFYAAFWDPPHESQISKVMRRYLAGWFERAQISRNFRLFCGDPPASRTTTLVLTITDAEGRVSRWGWNQAAGLYPEDPLREKHTTRNHRLRKFVNALMKTPELQEQFGQYVLQLARAKGLDVQALTVDARLEHVRHIATGEPLESDCHRNLFSYVASDSAGLPLAAMACALGDRSRSPLLVDVLVYLAAREVTEQRTDTEYLQAIRDAATNAEWPPVASEDLEATRAFVTRSVVVPERRELYTAILDALTGARPWSGVFDAMQHLQAQAGGDA
jgi:hypothetical protein